MSGMSEDDELELWRTDWKADSAPIDGLRRKVDRDTAWLRLSIATDLLAAAAFAAAAAWLALRYPHPAVFLLSAAIWVLTLVAVSFSVRNQVSVLRPEAESVTAFLEITRERRRREVRAATFGLWFLLAELVFLIGWLWWNRGRELFPGLEALSPALRILPVAIPIACYAWLERMRRRARRELSRLSELERDVEG